MTRSAPRPSGADIREELVSLLIGAIDSAMSRPQATRYLQDAKAWHPVRAFELHRYLQSKPDAFVAPTHDGPASLPRLLTVLANDGYADSVTLLGCARCGRTDAWLRRRSPEGRCCGWCVVQTQRRPCARCGTLGLLTARRAEGSVCRRCYNKDPEFLQVCAGCGAIGPPTCAAPTARCCAKGAACRRHAPAASAASCAKSMPSPPMGLSAAPAIAPRPASAVSVAKSRKLIPARPTRTPTPVSGATATLVNASSAAAPGPAENTAAAHFTASPVGPCGHGTATTARKTESPAPPGPWAPYVEIATSGGSVPRLPAPPACAPRSWSATTPLAKTSAPRAPVPILTSPANPAEPKALTTPQESACAALRPNASPTCSAMKPAR